MRVLDLPGPGSQTTKTGDGLKRAVAQIKALQFSDANIQQIEASIRSLRSIAGQHQSTETSAGFIQQATAPGNDDQAKVIAGNGNTIQ